MPVSIASLSAWISIEGNRADCYSEEYSPDGKTVHCWIASEAGKPFSVNWKDSDRSVSTRATLRLDGVQTHGGHLYSLSKRPRDTNIVTRTYKRISNEKVRPLVFSSIQLTDDESLCLRTANEAKNVGVIELIIDRVKIRDCDASRPSRYQDPGDLASAKIHEREKKGSVHRIRLDMAVQKVREGSVTFKSYGMLAKFVFHYTSYDILLADGRIPRALAPGTPHRSSKRGRDEANGADQRPKRSKLEPKAINQPKVKREPPARVNLAVEVIDLTV